MVVSDFGARKKYDNLKPDTSGLIFPTGKALQIKFPTSRAQEIVKCPSLPVGDIEVLI